MSEDFMAGVEQEGKALLSKLDEEKKETSPESPAEENQTDTSPSSDGEQAKPDNNQKEKNVPFDQHPRWIEREKEWSNKLSSYEETLKSYKDALDELRSTPQANHEQQSSEIPAPFVRLFGENQEAWKEWQALTNVQKDLVKQELIHEQELAKQQQVEETNRWNKWVETSLNNIESKHGVDFKGDESLKNEFMSFMLKRKPTDDQGNFDFEGGWEWFQEVKQIQSTPEKSKARKAIAAATSSEPSSEGKAKDFYTPNDLRRRAWKDLTET